MQRDTGKLGSRQFDLVVVGGGAYGCCAAWDAASRGLSVALIEKDDFCQATSANHLKMVHGGIRYLQHMDFRRVRESMRERSALLRIAPHLVRPIPIMMPTYGRGKDGKLLLRAGLALYDMVAADRNREIKDPGRRVPRGRIVGREDVLEQFPFADSHRLSGAGVFYDGQFYNPPRLCLEFLQAAAREGAQIANYVRAMELQREDDRVYGVRARDEISGESFGIRARVVLNAAGPWAAGLLERVAAPALTLDFSRDVGLVLNRQWNDRYALACHVSTSDPDAVLSRSGRHVFLVPWRGLSLLGVWHRVHTGDVASIAVDRSEIESWLEELNRAYPSLALSVSDVSMVYSGLTLFGSNRPGAKDLRFGKRALLLDHAETHGVNGLVTMVGIRATMARGIAARAVDRVILKLGKKLEASPTDRIPLPGGDIADFDAFLADATRRHRSSFSAKVIDSLAHNYGTRLDEVVKLAMTDRSLSSVLGSSSIIGAEVVWAIRHEMAATLADVVFRRTDLASGGDPGSATIAEAAAIMARELGWDGERVSDEILRVNQAFPKFR